MDGWQIFVGRGAVENDELTFGVADEADLWLHVAGGVPGSHVVIRRTQRLAPPREVIERAAQLAAWYSKARAARRVEVHVCAVADVTKPRGAKPGLVHLRRFEKVFVTPAPLGSDEHEPAPVGDADTDGG